MGSEAPESTNSPEVVFAVDQINKILDMLASDRIADIFAGVLEKLPQGIKDQWESAKEMQDKMMVAIS